MLGLGTAPRQRGVVAIDAICIRVEATPDRASKDEKGRKAVGVQILEEVTIRLD